MTHDFAAVVMAAGLGTRMRSATPKHLHPLLGRRLVDWVIAAATEAGADPIVVVASPDTRDEFEGMELAVQERPLGTGDAVRAAREKLGAASRDVLVLSGDAPLLSAELLRDLVATHRDEQAAATVLAFEPPQAGSYGRIVRDESGRLTRIVEAVDATPEELELREVNSSIYVFAAEKLWPALEQIEPQNAQGELYLTDTIGILADAGEAVAVHVAPDPVEAEGINTRVELAAAAAALRDRINHAHMLAGVTIVDPNTTWIEPGVELEPDVTIHPSPSSAGGRRSHATPRSSPGSSPSTRRSAPVSPWDRSVTFAPARCSTQARRQARSWSSRTPTSAKVRRSRTSPTSATPTSAR